MTRVATDGTRNACSFLYGLAATVAQAQGYLAIITYTLKSESGASLRALGSARPGRLVQFEPTARGGRSSLHHCAPPEPDSAGAPQGLLF